MTHTLEIGFLLCESNFLMPPGVFEFTTALEPCAADKPFTDSPNNALKSSSKTLVDTPL